MSIPTVFRKRRGDGDTFLENTSFLVRESAEVYHAQVCRNLSSHQLADFRRNPPLDLKLMGGAGGMA